MYLEYSFGDAPTEEKLLVRRVSCSPKGRVFPFRCFGGCRFGGKGNGVNAFTLFSLGEVAAVSVNQGLGVVSIVEYRLSFSCIYSEVEPSR